MNSFRQRKVGSTYSKPEGRRVGIKTLFMSKVEPGTPKHTSYVLCVSYVLSVTWKYAAYIFFFLPPIVGVWYVFGHPKGLSPFPSQLSTFPATVWVCCGLGRPRTRTRDYCSAASCAIIWAPSPAESKIGNIWIFQLFQATCPWSRP